MAGLQVGEIVFLTYSAAIVSDGRTYPNWSHAFLTVLAKRGYSNVRCIPLTEFRSQYESLHNISCIIVGKSDQEGIVEKDLAMLRSIGVPVIVETCALSNDTLQKLQLRHFELTPGCMLKFAHKGKSNSILELMRTDNGVQDCMPFPRLHLETRYSIPDPRTFTLTKGEEGYDAIRTKVLLKQLFSLMRRSRTSPVLFQNSIDNATAIFGMALAIGQMRDGAHRRALYNTFQNLVDNAPCENEETNALLEMARVCISDKQHTASADQVLSSIPQYRQAKSKYVSAIEVATDAELRELLLPLPMPHIQSLLGYFALSDANEIWKRIFVICCEHRLDWEKSSFFTIKSIDGSKMYSNHPLSLVGLAAQTEEIIFEDWSLATTQSYSADLINIWASPPTETLHTLENIQGDPILSLKESSGQSYPIVLQNENILFFGYPLLSVLGYGHTLPPSIDPLYDSDHHHLVILEHFLFKLLEKMLEQEGNTSVCLHPWPHLHKTPLVIRHDADRPISDGCLDNILNYYADNNLKSSWYWIPGRLNNAHIQRISRAGHEIGLHCLYTAEKKTEKDGIAVALGKAVVGETYHGSGADYHLGATSVTASTAAGFSYSEVSPFVFGLPYAGFPQVNDNLSISFLDAPINITFSYTTDAVAGRARKYEASATAEFSNRLANTGYYTCVLNHPDLNFDELKVFLEAKTENSFQSMTAADLSRWWRGTHDPEKLILKWKHSADKTILTVHNEMEIDAIWVKVMGAKVKITCLQTNLPAVHEEIGGSHYHQLILGQPGHRNFEFVL